MDQNLDEEYDNASAIWNTQNSLEANYSSCLSHPNYSQPLSPDYTTPPESSDYYTGASETRMLGNRNLAEYEREEMPGDEMEQQAMEDPYDVNHWQQMQQMQQRQLMHQMHYQSEQLSYANGFMDTPGVEEEMQADRLLDVTPSNSVAAVYGGSSPPFSQAGAEQECALSAVNAAFPNENAQGLSSYFNNDDTSMRELATQLVDSMGGKEAKKKVEACIENAKSMHQELQYKAVCSMLLSCINKAKI